jgi:S1-C subfamily serine protease
MMMVEPSRAATALLKENDLDPPPFHFARCTVTDDPTSEDSTPTDPVPPTPAPEPGDSTGSGETMPSWPPSVPVATATTKPPGRTRAAITDAVVGGLVGALAAGGVFVATDGGGDTTTIVRQKSTPVVSRPSRSINDTGDVATIIGKAEPAIVAITTGDGPGTGTGGAGTGFVISADGFVVTNNHVVEGAKKIEVAFTDGSSKSATIVGNDPSADLAVLKVDATGLAAIELGASESVQVGDEVVAIGNALALEGGLSVTRGIISGTDRTVDTNEGVALVGMLQTDAAINPGNSGGPLLDAQARVIGINTAIANPTEAQNIGFAIPISRAKPIIDDLRLGRKPAFLGVSTQNVTPAVARELGLQIDSGAYVQHVTADGPAADVGVQEGDVIVDIGGVKITSSADVQTAVRTHRPGDTVAVVVDRKGERKSFDAKLVERPDAG